MSTEALNRIIKEVDELTLQERRELMERLAHEGPNSHEQPDFDDYALSSSSTHGEEITADTATLRVWLNKARDLRVELPLTSDSVDILRELREVRSRQ